MHIAKIRLLLMRFTSFDCMHELAYSIMNSVCAFKTATLSVLALHLVSVCAVSCLLHRDTSRVTSQCISNNDAFECTFLVAIGNHFHSYC